MNVQVWGEVVHVHMWMLCSTHMTNVLLQGAGALPPVWTLTLRCVGASAPTSLAHSAQQHVHAHTHHVNTGCHSQPGHSVAISRCG